jgi:trigger factor
VSSTLKTLDPTQVELEISITPEEFGAAQDAAFRSLSRNAKVPGFRPGKVPRKIFENQYGSGQIVQRALDDLATRKYPQALEEHGIEPLANPAWDLVESEAGQPPTLKATVPVRPPIELQPYAGIEVPDLPDAATEEELEAALDRLRQDAAVLVPVDRPVRLGDRATLDYEGKIDGVPFEGGTAQGQETEIKQDSFIPGFVDGIVGMTAGETKDVQAHFPAEYNHQELAGKDAVFTITVHEVKEPELPPLDDELAKRVSRWETLEELRGDLKRRLDEQVKQKARGRVSSVLLEKIVGAHDFPLPEVLVERELDALLNESRQYVSRAGIEWDAYIAGSGKSEHDLREQFREEARRRVKTTLVVEAIAKQEGVQATQADIEGELDALAAQYGQPRERIAEALRANVGALIDGIVRTKTIDRLIEQAKRVPATEDTSA